MCNCVYLTNEEASAPRTTEQCFVAALTKAVCPQMVQAIDRRLRSTARRGRVRRPIARSPLHTSAQCATISTVGVPETRASERPIDHGICAVPGHLTYGPVGTIGGARRTHTTPSCVRVLVGM